MAKGSQTVAKRGRGAEREIEANQQRRDQLVRALLGQVSFQRFEEEDLILGNQEFLDALIVCLTTSLSHHLQRHPKDLRRVLLSELLHRYSVLIERRDVGGEHRTQLLPEIAEKTGFPALEVGSIESYGQRRQLAWWHDHRSNANTKGRVNLVMPTIVFPNFEILAFHQASLLVARRVSKTKTWFSLDLVEIPAEVIEQLAQVDPAEVELPDDRKDAEFELPGDLGSMIVTRRLSDHINIEIPRSVCRPLCAIHYAKMPEVP